MSNQPNPQSNPRPSKATVTCKECQHVNPDDALFCEQCHTILTAKTSVQTIETPIVQADAGLFDGIDDNATIETVDKEGASASAVEYDRVCPDCGHHNQAGVVLCDDCGKKLVRSTAPEGSSAGRDKADAHSPATNEPAKSEAIKAEDLFKSTVLDENEVREHIASALDAHQAKLQEGMKPPSGVLRALEAARRAIKQADSAITGIDENAAQEAIHSADSAAQQESHKPDGGARNKAVDPPLRALADANGRLPTYTFRFESDMVLRLEFAKSGKSMDLHMEAGKKYIIGRSDPTQDHKPDIDITAIYGDARGVSRSHAQLMLTGNRIEITDLNSTNGTFLNGLRFNKNEIHEIRSGDSINLAHVGLHVYFHVEPEELVDQSAPTGALNSIHKMPTAPLTSQ